MTKKQLSEVADSLRDQAKALELMADVLEGKDKAEDTAQEPAVPAEKPVTLEQVRAVLAEKSRNGLTDKVRELIVKHGADKLSAINPAEYKALLAEAEVL